MLLQDIWFYLWGLLWAIFFITDGFDFGIGTMLPFLGKDEYSKRVMHNAVGPLWDGNEVWLLTAGGVTFAAFPAVYAVMFSSLYSALMIILFSLILRGVAFEFRGKIDSPNWKKIWDTCIFLGSVIPAILFGAAFANIFRGLPIDSNGIYQGTLLTLLNPYGLLGGVLFLLLFLVHGAIWLAIRSDGELHESAINTAGKIWPVLLAVAVIFLISSIYATSLYDNYIAHPALFLVIILTVAALLGSRLFLSRGELWKAWFSSAATIAGATFYGIIGLYPNMFPSSIDPMFSLSAHNSSSSPLTLKIMLIVTVLLVPVILAYQIWSFTLFKGKVTEEELASDDSY